MIVHLVLTVLCVSTSLGFDYCSLCSGKHTMCIYNSTPKGECTGQYAGMSDGMRRAVLHRHNELRAVVARGEQEGQPPAKNMMKLTWNKEIEEFAQRSTSQCQGKLDACRLTADGSVVTQNTGKNYLMLNESLEKRRDEALVGITEKWYAEVVDVDPSQVDIFTAASKGGQIGRYTMVVWATSKELGCGYVEEQPKSGSQLFYSSCNYKPGGNCIGASVYQRGEPCSSCPTGTHCSKIYHGLCTAEDEKDEDVHDGGIGPSNKPTAGSEARRSCHPLLLASCVALILYHGCNFDKARVFAFLRLQKL